MRDSNKVYEQFFIECAKVGSERCALATGSPSKLGDESEEDYVRRAAKDLQISVDNFISQLWDSPMQVEEGQNGPGLLTAQDLSFVVSSADHSRSDGSNVACNRSSACSTLPSSGKTLPSPSTRR